MVSKKGENWQSLPIDAVTWFNASSLASKLNHEYIAVKFAKLAFLKHNEQDYRTHYLRLLEETSSNDEEREKAYHEIMESLSSISGDSPEFVINEAWNVSNDRRDYKPLVDAISGAIDKLTNAKAVCV